MTLLDLAARCESATGPDNALDVLIEVALFDPGSGWAACRANSAGTKVIYTRPNGMEMTLWANDWTMGDRRKETAAAIRARAQIEGQEA